MCSPEKVAKAFYKPRDRVRTPEYAKIQCKKDYAQKLLKTATGQKKVELLKRVKSLKSELRYILESSGDMAATRLIALHINKGKTIAQTLADRTDYSKNEEKTEGGKYISSYECDARTADEQFLLSKRQYEPFSARLRRTGDASPRPPAVARTAPSSHGADGGTRTAASAVRRTGM